MNLTPPLPYHTILSESPPPLRVSVSPCTERGPQCSPQQCLFCACCYSPMVVLFKEGVCLSGQHSFPPLEIAPQFPPGPHFPEHVVLVRVLGPPLTKGCGNAKLSHQNFLPGNLNYFVKCILILIQKSKVTLKVFYILCPGWGGSVD